MTTTAAGDAAVARLNKATEAFEKIITGASNQVVDVPGYGNQPTLAARVDERLDETTATAAAEADRSRDEADRATTQANAAANSVTLAAAEYNKAQIQADRAQSEADRAAQITGLDTVSDAVALAALPLPDVWAPLSDSLRMITGYGRDVLVGSDVVARMVNFSRNSTATYIGKDGQLKTAAENEPRFEKEGLLIEGQSTNLIVRSEKDYVTGSPFTNYTVETGLLLDGRKAVKFIPNAPRSPVAITTALSSNQSVTVGWHTASFLCDVDLTGDNGYMRGVIAPLVVRKIRDGLYRASVTINIPTVGANELHIYPSVAVTITGLQLEALPFASSYIPTNGAAVTRAADQAWLPAAGNRFIGGLYATACEFDLLGRVAGASSSRLVDFDNSGGADRQYISITENGQLQCVMGPSQTAASVTGKLAGRAAMRMSNFALNVMLDGVAGSSVTATGIGLSANNRIVLMNTSIFNLPSYGHIRNLRMWSKHPISNDQLRTAV